MGAIEIERLSVKLCPHLIRLTNCPFYLALASCAALLKYIQQANNMIFLPRSLRIKFCPNEDKLFLDMQTIEGLELLENGHLTYQEGSQRLQGSQLHVIDKTKTRAGRRLLRRSLVEPSTDRTNIKNRQDAVEELIQNEDIYFDVVGVLAKFPDIERALAVLTAREQRNTRRRAPSNRAGSGSSQIGTPVVTSKDVDDIRKPCMTVIRSVLVIKAGIEAAVDLHAALREAKSPLLCMAANTIRVPVLGRLNNAINDVINEEAETSRDLETMRLQGAFAVKSGLNGMFDTL